MTLFIQFLHTANTQSLSSAVKLIQDEFTNSSFMNLLLMYILTLNVFSQTPLHSEVSNTAGSKQHVNGWTSGSVLPQIHYAGHMTHDVTDRNHWSGTS